MIIIINTLYPIFRRWSDGGSIYIYSDPHFDDEDRPVMGYHISEEAQIMILKKYVHKNDTLICLGDVGNPKYLAKLKCYKVLICGNHDLGVVNYKKYFDEIYTGPLFIAEKILLSHEPCPIDGVVNIHGHDHAGRKLTDYKRGRLLNCAANVISFIPLSLGQLIKNGLLSGIDSRHRLCIDEATEKAKKKNYNRRYSK